MVGSARGGLRLERSTMLICFVRVDLLTCEPEPMEYLSRAHCAVCDQVDRIGEQTTIGTRFSRMLVQGLEYEMGWYGTISRKGYRVDS